MNAKDDVLSAMHACSSSDMMMCLSTQRNRAALDIAKMYGMTDMVELLTRAAVRTRARSCLEHTRHRRLSDTRRSLPPWRYVQWPAARRPTAPCARAQEWLHVEALPELVAALD
jgi:hypothetical protein